MVTIKKSCGLLVAWCEAKLNKTQNGYGFLVCGLYVILVSLNLFFPTSLIFSSVKSLSFQPKHTE
jgi:hypothetical protein